MDLLVLGIGPERPFLALKPQWTISPRTVLQECHDTGAEKIHPLGTFLLFRSDNYVVFSFVKCGWNNLTSFTEMDCDC